MGPFLCIQRFLRHLLNLGPEEQLLNGTSTYSLVPSKVVNSPTVNFHDLLVALAARLRNQPEQEKVRSVKRVGWSSSGSQSEEKRSRIHDSGL